MTDLTKTLVLLLKHSILNVCERGSVYLARKKIYGGGVSDFCATLYIIIFSIVKALQILRHDCTLYNVHLRYCNYRMAGQNVHEKYILPVCCVCIMCMKMYTFFTNNLRNRQYQNLNVICPMRRSDHYS